MSYKGFKLSEETKNKIRKARQKQVIIHSEQTKKKISEAHKGKICSIEHRANISKSKKGQKRRPHSEETRKKISQANKGKIRNEETRKRMSVAKKGCISWNKGNKGYLAGEKHYKYIKDRTKLSKQWDRRSSIYEEWRKQVWLRDNFKCKIANPDCSGRLEAHHILGWTEYPELRYSLNNGITLCHAHHPRKRAEEKRLILTFQELVSVSKQ